MNRKPGAAVAGMTLVLLTAVLVSLSMGSVRVPVLSVLGQALGLCAQRTGEYATQAYILAQVRLPRIVLCMLTGISLGVGGCVMQTLFRNPLASPFTMGVPKPPSNSHPKNRPSTSFPGSSEPPLRRYISAQILPPKKDC